jgi:hypothetical protein
VCTDGLDTATPPADQSKLSARPSRCSRDRVLAQPPPDACMYHYTVAMRRTVCLEDCLALVSPKLAHRPWLHGSSSHRSTPPPSPDNNHSHIHCLRSYVPISAHTARKVQAREGRRALVCRRSKKVGETPLRSSQSSSSPFSSRPPIHGLYAPPLEPSKVVWPRALHHPRTTFWRWRVVII